MKRYCIIGYPVSHSISPYIYNEYFKFIKFDGMYELNELNPEIFDDEIRRIFENYVGFNVTIPYKEKIIRHLSDIEEGSKIIGAVNCVVTNGKKGYNTDWIGFVRSIKNEKIKGKKITVIGSGGASRAVIYGLRKLGIFQLTLLNRTYEKAIKLKEWAQHFDMKIKVEPFEELPKVVKDTNILINTTSVGMKGESFDLSKGSLKNVELIYDVIYFKTPLQSIGEELGIKVIDGKMMLYYQAVENLKVWNMPLEERIFERIFDDVVNRKNRKLL